MSSTMRIGGAADTLLLKHTAQRWQETAGSDSVLLSVEITGICVWAVFVGCHNHSKDFHWV